MKVLILVLLEYVRIQLINFDKLKELCLNPCFVGICKDTYVSKHFKRSCSSLNPCFVGICKDTVQVLFSPLILNSLNPCFVGICKDTMWINI